MDPVSKSSQNSGNMPLGRRFVKGQSGNPGGRPKKSLLQQRMEERANDPEFVERAMAAMEERMLSGRMVGALQADKFSERVDGRVAQVVEMEVSGKISLEQVLTAERRANGDSDESSLEVDATSSDLQDGSPEIR